MLGNSGEAPAAKAELALVWQSENHSPVTKTPIKSEEWKEKSEHKFPALISAAERFQGQSRAQATRPAVPGGRTCLKAL